MANNDNKNKIELSKLFENTKVKKVEVTGELKKSFISYAMAVNVSRAIPDVRDGLKPVHRRILYSMGEMNLFANTPYKKSARIVGEVMGKFHPHGDSSVYDALVRLAQNFSINLPLVDGHGNFGSVDGDPPAAQRYTEARLSKVASEMLRDIDKETVDTYPNFDDTLQQPVVLPARFPNLLVNGADGIAVGMATNIPPHNLGECIDGVVAMIDNPEIEIDELIRIIPAPDFPTGGLIMGRSAIKHAYKTGRGGIVVRGRADIEETSTGRMRIIITELPYQVNKARLIIQMADLVKAKKLEGISDLRDESDRDGMRIVVDVKKDANAQVVLNSLYKHTQLQVSDGIILLALADGTPRILNLKQILEHYLAHQRDVITRRTQFDLSKAKEREHIVKGLVIALANIDEVIKIIKNADEKQEASAALCERFLLSEKQANAILDMKLSRLTGLEVHKLEDELAALEVAIADYEDILAKPERIDSIIKTELGEIKDKYATPRKTEISMEMGGIDVEDLIEKEDVVVSRTFAGYVKRMSLDEYHAQHRGGVGVSSHKTKEEDFVEDMFVANTHDRLLFFTNHGKVFSLKTYEIPQAQRSAKGRAMVNLLALGEGEKVTTIITKKDGADLSLVLATKLGLIKKTPLCEFDNIRQTGKIAISLNEGDELVGAVLLEKGDELVMAASSGKCIRFSESSVRSMGRTAHGVRSMKISGDDKIVDITLVRPGNQILTVSENGYGKRCNESEFRVQGRNGKGIKAGNFNEQTGKLVNLKTTTSGKDVMLVADNGVVIRFEVDQVPVVGRAAKGVKIMRLRDDAKVVTFAIVEHEQQEIEITEDDKAEIAEELQAAKISEE